MTITHRDRRIVLIAADTPATLDTRVISNFRPWRQCLGSELESRLTLAVADDGAAFDWRAAWNQTPDLIAAQGRGLEILEAYATKVRSSRSGGAVTKRVWSRSRNDASIAGVGTDRAPIQPPGDGVASIIGELRQQMQQLLAGGAAEIELDLSNVQMMDSRGMGLLIAAHNPARKRGGRFAVTHTSQDILELLHPMRIPQPFSLSGD